MDRSRRNTKVDKLAAYKRAREGGRREDNWDDDVALYDEVTDDQYKQIVKGRLAKDDFVVDDGIEGYMDNGMDDWGGGGAEEDSEEEEKRTCIRRVSPTSSSPCSSKEIGKVND